MWHITCDMWHVKGDTWKQVDILSNFRFIALTAWEWRFFKDLRKRVTDCLSKVVMRTVFAYSGYVEKCKPKEQYFFGRLFVYQFILKVCRRSLNIPISKLRGLPIIVSSLGTGCPNFGKLWVNFLV